MKMVRHAEDFEGKTPRHVVNLARVYLHNTCIDFYRAREKRQKHETIMTDLSEDLFDALTAMELKDVRERLEASERLSRVLEAMQKLPPTQREILMMHVQHGHSSQKLAEIFQISENAVNVRLYKARKKLKKLIGEDWDE